MKDTKVDENLYNEKSLNLLNIRELREIGRKFAVPSPTTMKKDDLISYILNIVYGKVVPPKRSAYGRPTLHKFDIKQYIEKIKQNSDIIEQLKDVRLDYEDLSTRQSTFAGSLAQPKEISHTGKIIQRSVFNENGKCFLREKQFVASKNDIEVSSELAKEFKLENYDVVELIESEIGIKIISKNGERISGKFEKFKINNENISDGTNLVFHLRTKEEIKDNILKIKDECSKQNVEIMLLKSSDEQDFEDGYVLNEENINKRYKQFMMFVEKCKQYVYENKNIFVVIENRKDIENMINSFDEDICERIKANLQTIVDNFLTLANVVVAFDLTKTKTY